MQNFSLVQTHLPIWYCTEYFTMSMGLLKEPWHAKFLLFIKKSTFSNNINVGYVLMKLSIKLYFIDSFMLMKYICNYIKKQNRLELEIYCCIFHISPIIEKRIEFEKIRLSNYKTFKAALSNVHASLLIRADIYFSRF